MIPRPFEYHAPSSTEDALALLSTYGTQAKLLAGGHSLLPMMKLRFARACSPHRLRPHTGAQGHPARRQRAADRRHDLRKRLDLVRPAARVLSAAGRGCRPDIRSPGPLPKGRSAVTFLMAIPVMITRR